MEILKTVNRFISIFLISALGVAFFAGVRAGEPDIRYSADAYFDAHNLMDLRVMSTMGLTQEDVNAIQNLDLVLAAEPGYSVEVLCDVDGSQKVLQIYSELPSINQSDAIEGQMPENPGECLVDSNFADIYGYNIGDKIQIYGEKEDSLEEVLKIDELTIVGIGNSPCFISYNRGNTTIGNGEVSGFLIVAESSFCMDVYTKIDITIAGALQETAYTTGYQSLVEKVQGNLEGVFAKKREQERYQEIMDDAEKELADAWTEYNDGKVKADQELADAKAELEDGDQELADARLEYHDGVQEYEKGKEELSDQETKLVQEEKKLLDGEQELIRNKQKHEDGYSAYEEALKNLLIGKKELEEGKKAILGAEEKYEEGMTGLNLAEGQLSEINTAIAQFTAAGHEAPADLLAQKQVLENVIAEQKPVLEAANQEITTSKAFLDANEAKLTEGLHQLEDSKKQLDDASEQIAKAEQEIAEGKQKIEDGLKKISDAKQELLDAELELLDAKKKLEDAEAELMDGWNEYNKEKEKAKIELADAKIELEDAEQEVAEIEFPEWIFFDRDDLPSYAECGINADRIKAVGQVFPVIFFLVAALISLTTMTRMVEEQRVQIGTLKSLGYGKLSIAGKYISYALFASLGGSLVGLLVGQKVIPYVIVSAYRIMYPHMLNIVIPYDFYYGMLATAAAVACTLFATLAACMKELKAQPAALMRPVPPKQGKRTILEKTFLWKRLSFNYKSTLRNLIRYKKRFFMMVIGIGGCMALMVVGFGLQDSIMAIGDLQYSEIQKYDATILMEDNVAQSEQKELLEFLDKNDKIEHYVPVYMKKITVKVPTDLSVVFTVPRQAEGFDEYVNFRNRKTKEQYRLDDEGIILNEKLADMLQLSVGDEMTINLDDYPEVKVRISKINETYLGHYIYMSEPLFEKIYGETPESNTILVQIAKEADRRVIGQELLSIPAAMGISYIDVLLDQVGDMLSSLDTVIIVLIISAGMLAFVVLYNLNNININERQRELATIKVLGFYDAELAGYVYRENILLTLIGIAFGVVAGKLLHGFVIVTVEVESTMFGRVVSAPSFLYCAFFTLLFAALVNGAMYFKLKKIDMVESLKSVE